MSIEKQKDFLRDLWSRAEDLLHVDVVTDSEIQAMVFAELLVHQILYLLHDGLVKTGEENTSAAYNQIKSHFGVREDDLNLPKLKAYHEKCK